MSKLKVLLTGADTQFGQAVGYALATKYDLYYVSKNPYNFTTEDNDNASKWILEDVSPPTGTVQTLMSLSPMAPFHAFINCSNLEYQYSTLTLNSFDIMKAISENALEPSMLVKYGIEFGVLDWSGTVVFVQRKEVQDYNKVCSQISHDVVPVIVNHLSRDWPVTLKVHTITPQLESKRGSANQLAEKILEVLESKDLESSKVAL